jgi:hypothetical protein
VLNFFPVKMCKGASRLRLNSVFEKVYKKIL